MLLCQHPKWHWSSPHSSQGSAGAMAVQDIPLVAFIPIAVRCPIQQKQLGVYLLINTDPTK